MLQTRVDSGLDGVIVADTVMSEVDGEEGRLVVRGHAVEELVETRGYEGVAALLWEGYGEGGGNETAVRDGLAMARVRAFALVPKLLTAAEGLTPVEGLTIWSAARCRCSSPRCSMPPRACRRSRPIHRSARRRTCCA